MDKYMRGDCVGIDGHIRKVESVTARKIGYHIKEKECRMHYIRMQEVQPIPVMPEFLELLGLDKQKSSYADRYTKKVGTNTVEVCLVENSYFVNVLGCATCYVKYIHQLQQFVYIATGVELQLDLSKLKNQSNESK